MVFINFQILDLFLERLYSFWRWGLLTLSIGTMVSPESGAIELLRRYNVALNYAISKILSLDLRSVGRVHSALYRGLREWFDLPSRVAIDCYRDVLANAMSWRNNPRRGRKPKVKKLSMLLHPAENLQKKYSSTRYPAWRRRGILNRIRSYHRKARNILEDWARKTSLEIVMMAKKLRYAVAREDLTGLINTLRRIKSKDHRTKLIIMGYSRLGKWIDWQAMKLRAPLAIVDPNGTSTECPQCDSKLEENGYRRLKCPRCSFEADRDVIGKLNIRKRALKILGISGRSLTPLTAPQMTDVAPNRWGEPMIRLKGMTIKVTT